MVSMVIVGLWVGHGQPQALYALDPSLGSWEAMHLRSGPTWGHLEEMDEYL